MISEIIQPEKRDISYEFDLPVMVTPNNVSPEGKHIVILTDFVQNDDGDFAYKGYHLGSFYTVFTPLTIYDKDIKHWSRFKGKVVLSNFAECE